MSPVIVRRWALLFGLALFTSCSRPGSHGTSSLSLAAPERAQPKMTAHFIDVGQGAATFFTFPCGTLLIDTGGQDDQHIDHLIDYLEKWFKTHPERHDTIDVLIITHPHIDHAMGLPRVAKRFTILNYVDDGLTAGSGHQQVQWFHDEHKAGHQKAKMRAVTNKQFNNEDEDSPEPLTDAVIDPIHCEDCDPKITVLAGAIDPKDDWPIKGKAAKNPNNNSVVVRVDFGKSSFLITGDLEKQAIGRLVDFYEGTDYLDVDVYMAGHHGSHNATTDDFLGAITPKMAVIGVGHWDYGKVAPKDMYNTYAYGHPRRVTIDALARAIKETRPTPVKAMIANGVKDFEEVEIKKQIYATAWDGDIRVTTDMEEHYTVTLGSN